MHPVALSLSIPRGQAFEVTSRSTTGSVSSMQPSRVAYFFREPMFPQACS
jgi:hypothetical protein